MLVLHRVMACTVQEDVRTTAAGKPSAATWLWVLLQTPEFQHTCDLELVSLGRNLLLLPLALTGMFRYHQLFHHTHVWWSYVVEYSWRNWALDDIALSCQLDSCCNSVEGQRKIKAIHDNNGDSRSQISPPPKENKSRFMGIASRQLLDVEQAYILKWRLWKKCISRVIIDPGRKNLYKLFWRPLLIPTEAEKLVYDTKLLDGQYSNHFPSLNTDFLEVKCNMLAYFYCPKLSFMKTSFNHYLVGNQC